MNVKTAIQSGAAVIGRAGPVFDSAQTGGGGAGTVDR